MGEDQSVVGIEPVPVRVSAPVEARFALTEGGASDSRSITTAAERLLQRNLNRRRVVLLAKDNPIFWGWHEATVEAGRAFQLATGVPLELTAVNDIWVASTTGSAVVSYLSEDWAE